MEDYRFKVNLGGMIEILSDHLYSSPDVYIRELLQNGVDAITGRKKLESGQDCAHGTEDDTLEGKRDYGCITLDIEEGKSLIFSDNGQGLTEEEIHQFLAIIGESSKRNLENGRIETDYIGRFGIGLLSCFMVSDEIRMLTRSWKDKEGPILEWCGKPDGTYNIKKVEENSSDVGRLQGGACGTSVILLAKPGMESYFTKKVIEELITYYGLLLPFPIMICQDGAERQINPTYLPWEGRSTNQQELLLFGQMMFDEQFFDCVPFQSEEGNVSGVAYIRKFPVLPSARVSHRIYLKNMLLTEKGDNLIPDWAVFTKCIVNATDLRPTASREGFYVDEVLEAAKEVIEDCLTGYIADLAENEPERFRQFFQIHQLTLMSLALATPKLFGTLADYFMFETTRGSKSGYDLRTCGEPLIYAPTEEKYKQLSQLFFAQDKQLINVSYVHSLDLLKRLGAMYQIEVSAVEDWAVEDLMKDLSPEDQDEGFEFLKMANRILKPYDCKAELKYFSPYHLPTFYLMDENTLLRRQIASSRAQSNSLFFNMLDAFASDLSNERAATLYFNYNNPLVRKLAGCEEEKDGKVFVEILYVQALQIGGFSLHNNEMGMLNRNIMTLMERGLSDV
ncbi:MAG: HSP90 family protein [Lachnospiraceae bacterium]|nr:HSP90 family protein [Lachnospiraceae bacterium]